MADKLNVLQLNELCRALGWQGGTFWQVLDEVKRLRRLMDEAQRRDRSHAAMAAEYEAWIAFWHAGNGDYPDFLSKRLNPVRSSIGESNKPGNRLTEEERADCGLLSELDEPAAGVEACPHPIPPGRYCNQCGHVHGNSDGVKGNQ